MKLRSLVRSARLLVGDLSGTLVFAGLMAAGVGVIPATVAGVAVAAGLVGVGLVRRKPIGALQWLSLFLVAVSGIATLFTGDPRFVMAKPTVICFIVGAVMLKPGWLDRYIPHEFGHLIHDVTWLFGYIWSALLFLTGALNLLFAVWLPQWWIAFLALFPVLSKLALFAVHFGISAIVADRRRRVEAEAPAVQGQIIG